MPRTGRSLPTIAVPLGLASSVVAASLLLNRSVFEGLPHTEDEVAYLFQAATIARGHLVASAPPVPDAFAIPFVIVRDGLWFGKYPPGYPLILALGILVGYPALVNALAAGASILLVFTLASRIYGFATGALAATLLAVSPFFLLQSASFMAHPVCLLSTLVFTLSFAVTLHRPTLSYALAGALALAMLVLARPLSALGVAAPFVVWSLWRLWRYSAWRPVGLLYASGGMLGCAALLAYNLLTTGDPLVFGYELWWPFDKVGFGTGISPDGTHTVAEGLLNTRYNLRLLEQVLYGWPGRLDLLPALLAVTAAVGRLLLWPLLRDVRRPELPTDLAWDLALAAQATTLVAVHIAYWTAGQMYGPRYYFEALGAVAVLTARGSLAAAAALRWLWDVATARAAPPQAVPTTAVLVLLALCFWGLFVTALPWWQSFRGWYGIRADPARQVAARAPANSVVLLPISSWTEYAPYFVRNSPFLDSSVLFAHDLGPRNGELLAAFPERTVVRYVGGVFVPLRLVDPESTPRSAGSLGEAGVG